MWPQGKYHASSSSDLLKLRGLVVKVAPIGLSSALLGSECGMIFKQLGRREQFSRNCRLRFKGIKLPSFIPNPDTSIRGKSPKLVERGPSLSRVLAATTGNLPYNVGELKRGEVGSFSASDERTVWFPFNRTRVMSHES